eukprot:4838786-Prymnesium_polylepis.1
MHAPVARKRARVAYVAVVQPAMLTCIFQRLLNACSDSACAETVYGTMTMNYSEYGGRHSVRHCVAKWASLWQRCLLFAQTFISGGQTSLHKPLVLLLVGPDCWRL